MKTIKPFSNLAPSTATLPMSAKKSLSEIDDFEVILHQKIVKFIFDELNYYFNDDFDSDDREEVIKSIREFIESIKESK